MHVKQQSEENNGDGSSSEPKRRLKKIKRAKVEEPKVEEAKIDDIFKDEDVEKTKALKPPKKPPKKQAKESKKETKPVIVRVKAELIQGCSYTVKGVSFIKDRPIIISNPKVINEIIYSSWFDIEILETKEVDSE